MTEKQLFIYEDLIATTRFLSLKINEDGDHFKNVELARAIRILGESSMMLRRIPKEYLDELNELYMIRQNELKNV